MSASVLLISLVLVQAPPEKAVTDGEKQAFLKLVKTLPIRGEFFTDEGVAKAVPHVRVLLSLTEDDVKDFDLYAFLALSSGLMGHEEAREEGLKRFDQIAHPTMKLFWGSMLMKQPDPPPHITTFLKKALDSAEDAKTLAGMAGPGFRAFKKSVNDAFEKGRRNRVELVTRHRIEKLPEFSNVFAYTVTSLVLSPTGSLHALRPLENRGELFVHDLATGSRKTRPVPQPPGVTADVEKFGPTFNSPLKLARNSRGDVLCSWTILGSGDHGLGLLKANAAEFVVKRIERGLNDSLMILDDQEGGWLLVVGEAQFTIFRVEDDLSLTALGSFEGEGQSSGVLDACLIGPSVIHCVWRDVIEGNHIRMRCVDFDLQRKTWLHDRVIQRIDQFANRPRVVQLADKTLHYVWSVDTGAEETKSAGIYCHSEADGRTIKVSDGSEFGAVSCANRLVVCTSDEFAPDKVSFRVVHNGTIHPPTEITIAQNRKSELWLEYMALAADADRIWFMNTQATDTLYELRLADGEGNGEK